MVALQKNRPNDRLRRARLARGWSQAQLAEQLSTNAMTIYRWETRRSLPSAHFRTKLCAIFDSDSVSLGIASAPDVAHDTAPCATWCMPLPACASLVGRDDVLDTLKRAIAQETCAAVALSGLPGVGKTTLALALVHDPEVRASFADGVLWASLGPTPNLAAQLRAWGNALGMPAADLTALSNIHDLLHAIHALIGSRRMLIMIDDAWTIEDALTFRLGGEHCVHLMTTRSPLLASQFAHHNAYALPELSLTAALDLFTTLAPDVVRQAPVAAASLVTAVGNLPLAITLMGKHLYQAGVSRQSRRIHAAITRLHQRDARLRLAEPVSQVEHPPHLPARSLQATIAIGVAALSSDARQVLHALAVFPAKPYSFTEAAGHAVSGLTWERFLSALDTLIDSGLVGSLGAERYHLHQTIADYVLNVADMAGAQRHMVRYYRAFLRDHSDDEDSISRELPHILAARRCASALRLDEDIVQGTILLADVLLARGMLLIADHFLTEALTLATGQQERAIILRYLCECACAQGRYQQAQGYIRERNRDPVPAGAIEQHCVTMRLLGQIALAIGEISQAERHFQDGLALARANGLRREWCCLLLSMGKLCEKQGDVAQALTWSEQSLLCAEAIGLSEQFCASSALLGLLWEKQGRYDEAEALVARGLALARRQDYHMRTCELLHVQVMIRLHQYGPTSALVVAQDVEQVARAIGHRGYLCHTLVLQALMLIALGALDRARVAYAEANAYAIEVGDQEMLRAITHLRARMMQAHSGLATGRAGEAAWRLRNMMMSPPMFK